MYRIQARSRIFDAEDILQISAGEEIFGAARDAAVLDIGVDGLAAAPVNPDRSAVVKGRRLYVDDTGGAQAVLRRQRARDEGQAADEARIQKLAEGAEPVRQQNVVDALGDVGVLVAHMQVPARRRILGDARELQQCLVDRCVGSLRQRLDGFAAERRWGGTHRRKDIVPLLIEPRRR